MADPHQKPPANPSDPQHTRAHQEPQHGTPEHQAQKKAESEQTPPAQMGSRLPSSPGTEPAHPDHVTGHDRDKDPKDTDRAKSEAEKKQEEKDMIPPPRA